MKVRTVAAIIAWFVVALLMINRVYWSEWILPIAIVLTAIAVLVYFSPRLRKKPNQTTKSQNQPNSNRVKKLSSSTFGLLKLIGNKNINC